MEEHFLNSNFNFRCYVLPLKNRDSLVGIETSYDLDCRGSIPDSVQTDSGANPVSYKIGTKGFFRNVKAAGV
jgi:hypothetical protein